MTLSHDPLLSAHMKENDLQYFRAYLLNAKSLILNKTHEFKTQDLNAQEPISDEADAASRYQAIHLSIIRNERSQATLLEIERALGKIDNGTFGQCESCGDHITLPRLKASPFALLCIQCREEEESLQPFLN